MKASKGAAPYADEVHVVVVDDERRMVELVTSYLQELGMTTTGCLDGKQALAAARGHGVDAVVLDHDAERLDPDPAPHLGRRGLEVGDGDVQGDPHQPAARGPRPGLVDHPQRHQQHHVQQHGHRQVALRQPVDQRQHERHERVGDVLEREGRAAQPHQAEQAEQPEADAGREVAGADGRDRREEPDVQGGEDQRHLGGRDPAAVEPADEQQHRQHVDAEPAEGAEELGGHGHGCGTFQANRVNRVNGLRTR